MMKMMISILVIVLAPVLCFGYVIGDYTWEYMADPMGENVYFNPNCADAGCGSDQDQINALWQGAKAWMDYGKANYKFLYGGTTAQSQISYNGSNIVFFSPTSSGSVIAATYYWGNGFNMTECDMIFYDGAWLFSAYQNPTNNEFDVWNIAAHELGHYLQLGHSSYTQATMYAYSSQGETSKRSLYSDDINGIQAIYALQNPFSVIVTTNDDSCARTFTQAGGSFNFTVNAYNNTAVGRYFRATIDVQLPDGTIYGPLLNMNSVYIGPNSSLTYSAVQNIPANGPVGEYRYRAHMRNTANPYTDYDVSFFMFWITGAAQGEMGDISAWKLPENEFTPADVLAGNSGNIVSIPGAFDLRPNVPNPFNPSTAINFDLYEDGVVSLELYNIAGQKIRTLIDREMLGIGPHSIIWNAADDGGQPVSAGIYLYKLSVGEKSAFKKMTLIK